MEHGLPGGSHTPHLGFSAGNQLRAREFELWGLGVFREPEVGNAKSLYRRLRQQGLVAIEDAGANSLNPLALPDDRCLDSQRH